MTQLQELIALFDGVFTAQYNTRLVKGGDEPLYLPADGACTHHRVIFARGYFSSALHEVAHWCIAGSERRLQFDYGYWYHPDGRSAEQQRAFEQVEAKPQAVEWAFHAACGRTFQVSCDNLGAAVIPDHRGFTEAVRQQALNYLDAGFPVRAAQLIEAMQRFYRQPPLSTASFALAN